MDMRSFEDNFEVMAMIYDEELTRMLEGRFVKDMKRSKKLKLKQWNERPLKQSIKE